MSTKTPTPTQNCLPPVQSYQPSRCNYIYLCKMAADGTFTFGPVGWEAERADLGTYGIVHSLGHTTFAVIPVGEGDNRATVLSVDEKEIMISTTLADAAADAAFELVILATQ